jgi:hypothetical protein
MLSTGTRLETIEPAVVPDLHCVDEDSAMRTHLLGSNIKFTVQNISQNVIQGGDVRRRLKQSVIEAQ